MCVDIIHGATRPEEVVIAQQAAEYMRVYIKEQSELSTIEWCSWLTV